jgi:hypothetical protein
MASRPDRFSEMNWISSPKGAQSMAGSKRSCRFMSPRPLSKYEHVSST